MGLGRWRGRGSKLGSELPPELEGLLMASLDEMMTQVVAEERIVSICDQIWGAGQGTHLFFCPAYDDLIFVFDNNFAEFKRVAITLDVLDDLEKNVLPMVRVHSEISDAYKTADHDARQLRGMSLARLVATGELDRTEDDELFSAEIYNPWTSELKRAHEAATAAIKSLYERHKVPASV